MKTRLFLLSCCLTIVSAFTFSSDAKAQCQSGFTYTVSGGTVTFTNTSTSQQGPNYSWNYGDNSTFGGYSGTHSYANSGVYYVCLTLDDTINLCTSTFCDSVHVLVGCNGLTASATSTDASSQSACDGTATGSVSGGTAPYAYMWSNSTTTASMSNLCVGNYQLTVTDANGCTSSANTMVNCPFVCHDTFSYNVSGLTALFYNFSNDTMTSQFSWSFGDNTYSNTVSPGHAYASAGTYNVLLIMSSNFLGCSDSMSMPVTVGGPNSCSVGFNMMQDSFILSQWNIYPSVTGQAPISYLWDFGDTTTSTQQFPTHNYTYACHHVVCLTITDANSCSSMYCDSSMAHRSASSYMGSVVVLDTTNLAGINEVKEFKGNTWPNPGSEFVNVVFNKNVSGILRLTDITGKLISEQKIDGQRTQLDVRNLSQGIYSISLVNEKTNWNEKIVIAR